MSHTNSATDADHLPRSSVVHSVASLSASAMQLGGLVPHGNSGKPIVNAGHQSRAFAIRKAAALKHKLAPKKPQLSSSFLTSSLRVQKELLAVEKRKLAIKKKKIDVLQAIQNDLCLLRHAYFAVHKVQVDAVES